MPRFLGANFAIFYSWTKTRMGSGQSEGLNTRGKPTKEIVGGTKKGERSFLTRTIVQDEEVTTKRTMKGEGECVNPQLIVLYIGQSRTMTFGAHSLSFSSTILLRFLGRVDNSLEVVNPSACAEKHPTSSCSATSTRSFVDLWDNNDQLSALRARASESQMSHPRVQTRALELNIILYYSVELRLRSRVTRAGAGVCKSPPDTLLRRLEGTPAMCCAAQSRPVYGPQRYATTPSLGLWHA